MKSSKSSYLGKPTNTVVVRGVDMFITSEDIAKAALLEDSLIVSIQPPPFQELAIIKFAHAADAKNFVEGVLDPGVVIVKNKVLYLDYLQEGEELELFVTAKKKVKHFTDWVCKNCRYNNFARRDTCHLCQVPREMAEQMPFADQPVSLAHKFSVDSMEKDIFKYGIFAREVVAVSELNDGTEKDTVRYTFAPVAAVKAVSIRKAASLPPMAFVEFYEEADADKALRLHKKTPFKVGDVQVKLCLAQDLPSDKKRLYELRLNQRGRDGDSDRTHKERRLKKGRAEKSSDFDSRLEKHLEGDSKRRRSKAGSSSPDGSKRRKSSDRRHGHGGREKSGRRKKTTRSLSSSYSRTSAYSCTGSDYDTASDSNSNSSGNASRARRRERGSDANRRQRRKEAHEGEKKSRSGRKESGSQSRSGRKEGRAGHLSARSGKGEDDKAGKKLQERFIYDPRSGFYFDTQSGYLYDPVTQVYCHGQTRHCYEWNSAENKFDETKNFGRFAFLMAPMQGNQAPASIISDSVKIINSSKPVPLKVVPAPSKTKSLLKIPLKTPSHTVSSKDDGALLKATPAKAIATDKQEKVQRFSKFGKIAKMASQLKNTAKAEQLGVNVVASARGQPKTENPTSRKTAHESLAKSILKSVLSQMAALPTLFTKLVFSDKFKAPNLVDPFLELGGRKDFFDYERIACLLCKRGFSSLETMKRHAKESELHKKNLQIFEIKKAARDKMRMQAKPVFSSKKPVRKYEDEDYNEDKERKDDIYRSNIKSKLKERFSKTKTVNINSEALLPNVENSEYYSEMKKFNSQNCSDKVETRNALVK